MQIFPDKVSLTLVHQGNFFHYGNFSEAIDISRGVNFRNVASGDHSVVKGPQISLIKIINIKTDQLEVISPIIFQGLG